jgi:anti-sigma regulatory factor (Ser/Thr protein kinase)/serine/threonine protein phosphatase PrpC
MEVASSHRSIAVSEASQPSTARFLAHELARFAGFNEEDTYRAGIVATEMTTNLVKHATGGEFLARVSTGGTAGEIELITIDRGPGMRDVTASLVDGHSTSGSPGTGLGAVSRLSDTFDLFSDPRGTVVFSRLRSERHAAPTRMVVAALSIPKPGEEVCGDAWVANQQASGATLVIADGLGHGVYAAEAAAAAVSAIDARRYQSAAGTMQAMHDGSRHTRGAAAAVANIDRESRTVRYAGIGNISTAILHNGTTRQAVSHNGTLGHEARVIREYQYPWQPDSILVMHSDGLATHWSVDNYRGLRQRHPAVIAAVLYRDHNRGRDDVTVLVGREA